MNARLGGTSGRGTSGPASGERHSQNSWKSSLRRYARTVRRLSFSRSASFGSCFSVRCAGRFNSSQRVFFSAGSSPAAASSRASCARTSSIALLSLAIPWKTVPYVDRSLRPLRHHPQVQLPHVRANVAQPSATPNPEPLEKLLQRLDLPLLAHPQQSPTMRI